MKNKSKLKKIKENRAVAGCPREWLYLNQKKISPRELAEVFQESEEITAQLWEDAGVVELELPEAGSLDLELADVETGEEEFDSWLREQQIQTLFLVTLVPEDYVKAEAAMKQILCALGGYFCGDNETFTPVVK